MQAMSPSSTRKMQIASIGALCASAIFLFRIRRQRQATPDRKELKSSDNENELSFYQNLGIDSSILPPHILRNIAKEQRRKSKVELLSMKSPMYDNVFMLDPDMELLCSELLNFSQRWLSFESMITHRPNNCSISNITEKGQVVRKKRNSRMDSASGG